MKISIGTAQFMRGYGVNRKFKNFNYNEKKKLIKLAEKNKIRDIDTAFSYKTAHKELGKIGIKKFRITTKLPKIPKKSTDYEKDILKLITKALLELKLKKIDTLLVHDYKNLIKNNILKYTEALSLIKKKGLVSKIGISLYNTEEIINILKFWKPDIIQVPYNIIDRRIEGKNILSILKKKKIKLQVRSIFLQGLILKKKRPQKFNRWRKFFDKWFLWCEKNNLEPFEAAYLFVKKNKHVNKVVIGFENFKQLKKIILLKNKKINIQFPNIIIKEKKLINPYNWRSLT